MERSGGRENEVECFREMIQQISSYHYIVSTDLIGKLSFFTLPSTQTHMNSLSIAQGEQRYLKLAQEERGKKREQRNYGLVQFPEAFVWNFWFRWKWHGSHRKKRTILL